MAGSKGKVSKNETAATNMANEMKKYANNIKISSEGVTAMMKGDGTDAYWQGQAAAEWYRKAIKYINKDIDNYRNSYNEFKKYAKQVGAMKGKKEGAKGTAIKANPRYNGSVFIDGVPHPDTVQVYNLGTSLPSTVDVDTVNDNFLTEAKNQYTQLLNGIKGLEGNMDTLIGLWDKIKGYCGGEINVKAGSRSNALSNRKKEITSAKEDLVDNFTSDLVFTAVDWK